jgi:pimeloyl-ACP methyl ester carboxylesterase
MSTIEIDGKHLDYTWVGPLPGEAPTLVFLHEGLGCAEAWRDFPARVVEATGYGALVYSRPGYGKSDRAQLPRSTRFMHDEALIVLPQLLDALKIREAVLAGHSDGGSIALIYAGGANEDRRVRGLILEAPHVFVEELTDSSIERLNKEFREGQLRAGLRRYHGEQVDETFFGWSEVWLDPEFKKWNIEEYLPKIQTPMLLLQGRDDEYGTLAQVETIQQGAGDLVKTVLLDDCGHAPHFDQPEATLAAYVEFCGGLVSGIHETKNFTKSHKA